jgi:hypothetical protein
VLYKKGGIEIDAGLQANGQAFGAGKKEVKSRCRLDMFEMAFWDPAQVKPGGFGFGQVLKK